MADVVLIMARIGNTADDDISNFLRSVELTQMVHDASSHKPTHIDPNPSCPLYRYRYRVRHSGRGPSWSSAGEILRHWLLAVLPPLLADQHSLTLIRRPLDQAVDDIHLSPTMVPAPDVLEHYIYDSRSDKGSPTLFEFWFTSSHPDMGSGLNPPGFSQEDKQYLARLSQHSITIMRMESHRTDLIPCILLVNSAVRDISVMIKSELVQ
jgi:hypothetical protein